MIVSCHQPNFFAYSGLLEKIRQSDVHVIMAQAQFNRQNYHHRFNIGERWFSMSTNGGRAACCEKRYVEPQKNWAAIKRKLPEFRAELDLFDDCFDENLVETNVRILRRLCDLLNIKTKIVMDYPTKLYGTARLVDLCAHYGATTYLSGPSGLKYMTCELFAERDILVSFQERTAPYAALELVRDMRGKEALAV